MTKYHHHLDKRADQILAAHPAEGPDDELLSTAQVALWFGVSEGWLEIGRSKNYGPRFTTLSDKVVRYKRGDCRKFIRSRTYSCTSEYEKKPARWASR